MLLRKTIDALKSESVFKPGIFNWTCFLIRVINLPRVGFFLQHVFVLSSIKFLGVYESWNTLHLVKK